jgi:hypothetical protein
MGTFSETTSGLLSAKGEFFLNDADYAAFKQTITTRANSINTQQQVARRLNTTPEWLAEHFTATNAFNSELIRITAVYRPYFERTETIEAALAEYATEICSWGKTPTHIVCVTSAKASPWQP